MDALAPVIPPALTPIEEGVPTWLALLAFYRNTLSSWPDSAFDDLLQTGVSLGARHALVNDPEAVRQVLTTHAARYRQPVAVIRVVRPVVGQGLLLSQGETWRRQRRMLAPAFNPTSVGALVPHFLAAGEATVRRVAGASPVNLSVVFGRTALDAVLRALFSVSDEGAGKALAATVRRFTNAAGKPNLFDGLAKSEGDFAFAGGGRRRFRKLWAAQVDAIIAERRRSDGGAARNDLLELLLAARDAGSGEPLDDEEIRDQASTMLGAGFETTSRLLFWTSYLLALDPAEQERVRAEVRAFSPDRVCGLDDLANWPRLRMTLLETLRLYPPAPYLLRDVCETDTLLGETLEPGARVWISPYIMHRHRRLWGQPAAFIPGRFAGQASPWTNGAFMPFGGGPRICIGASFAMAEAQVILATLLSRFAITLCDDRPVLPVGHVTTRPSHEPSFNLTAV